MKSLARLPSLIVLAALLLLPGAAGAATASPSPAEAEPDGTVRGFRVEAPDLAAASAPLTLDAASIPASAPRLEAPATASQQAVERADPPPRDNVGGFQVSLLGGVQLVGSASGQGGLALAYFKPSTAAIGVEAEAAVTLGPNGEVYHGLLSIILQSGARASKIVPYLSLGGGVFRAQVELRDAVVEELPNFGIELPDNEEQGALIALGFGVRYYLNDWLAMRIDYREFRALTEADDDFLDRLFALRRIGGMLSVEF